MSGLRLLAALGAVGTLAACPNCPPAIERPAAALVGVEGSARVVPWGEGALALCQGEPARGDGEELTANTLWEIERGGKARLWKQAAQVTRPLAIAGGPEGEVVVAEAGRGESEYPGGESPYGMALRRITADGRGRVLVRSQDATSALGGYRILTSCLSEIWPDDFTPAHLAMSPVRRVAVVMPTRGKLVLWSP